MLASNEAETSPLALLTARQREILQLIAEGQSTKEIGYRLSLSTKTVETHRRLLIDRLGIHDVAGLARFAIRAGLVSLRSKLTNRLSECAAPGLTSIKGFFVSRWLDNWEPQRLCRIRSVMPFCCGGSIPAQPAGTGETRVRGSLAWRRLANHGRHRRLAAVDSASPVHVNQDNRHVVLPTGKILERHLRNSGGVGAI